jgi:dTDP-4-amino-4,6-dideoxygalactose transaminase
VIYDAAHAFGVHCHCGSVLNHGDLSVLSFHATKAFNTFEGGAIVCQNADTKRYIDQLKNFGFTSETTVLQTGINGKMNEFSAALGLLQLKYIDGFIEKRKVIDAAYRHALKDIPGIRCHMPTNNSTNYGYFPIFVEDDYPLTRDQLYEKFKAGGINGRRYFFPLITDFPMYCDIERAEYINLTFAKNASDRVLCLPIYPDLIQEDLDFIVAMITELGKQ